MRPETSSPNTEAHLLTGPSLHSSCKLLKLKLYDSQTEQFLVKCAQYSVIGSSVFVMVKP